MSITSLHCFGGSEGRCWHACIFYIRYRFGTGTILRVPILKEGLPWLSSLASQDGATGGMTGSFNCGRAVCHFGSSCGDCEVSYAAPAQVVEYIILLPQCSRRQHLWWCTLRLHQQFHALHQRPFSMRCASTSREHMILVAVAHREGVHLPRFKAAEWRSLYRSRWCSSGRLLQRLTSEHRRCWLHHRPRPWKLL